MKIWKIAQSEPCPEEYGYNLTTDNRVAPVNWDEADIQMLKPWDEEVVKQFLGLPEEAIVYRTLADISDLNESLAEEEDDIEGGYDWSELQRMKSYPPPIVITRRKNDSIVINDGNHRVHFWREMGKDYIPAWCYDEKITEWIRSQKQADGE
jgi:hypothetical protein